MAHVCLETFKGRPTNKMESKSKLEISLKGKDRLPKIIPKIDYVSIPKTGYFLKRVVMDANMLSRYARQSVRLSTLT